MDASVEQLKRGRRRGGREEEEGGRFTDSEGAWSVCIGGERERKGERACAWCVCVRNGEREREQDRGVCACVCVCGKRKRSLLTANSLVSYPSKQALCYFACGHCHRQQQQHGQRE